MSFQGKVVIVTGASSGIGAATAFQFAEKGAKTVIVARNVTKLKKVEDASAKAGNKVHVIKADISIEADANRIINETLTKFGKIDILVNNAGILRSCKLLDGNLFDSFDEVLNTNLRAPVYLTTLAAPHLVKTKGNVVNVSSVHGKSVLRMSHHIAYQTAKAGLDHFSRSAAYELGAHGVRVNVVSPGPVATDLFENAGDLLEDKELREVTLLDRYSTSEETGKLILFLASDDAAGITGSDYVIDNGMLLK